MLARHFSMQSDPLGAMRITTHVTVAAENREINGADMTVSLDDDLLPCSPEVQFSCLHVFFSLTRYFSLHGHKKDGEE